MTNTAETEYAELIASLVDLHKQATLERSHYYVGSRCEKSVTAISTLLAENARLKEALKRAVDMLHSIAGDIEDGHSLADMRGKYVMAVLGARDRARAALHGDPQ